MSKPVTHIIHKLNLEIDVPDERLARKMYQQAGSLLQQYVLPKLEELLKRLDDGGLHIKLDKLDIDIDVLKTTSLEEVIKTQIAEAIKDKLIATISKEHHAEQEELPVGRTAQQQTIDAFIFFLEHGQLPWWFADGGLLADSAHIIEAISAAETKFVPDFVKVLKANSGVLHRLLLQYDSVLLAYLFSLLVPLEVFSIAAEEERRLLITTKDSINTESLKRLYWQQVWLIAPVTTLAQLSANIFQKSLQSKMAALLMHSVDGKEIDAPVIDTLLLKLIEDHKKEVTEITEEHKKEQRKEKDPAEDGLLAAHAGLLLLHPFLQYFFAELKLLDGENFRSKKCREMAVHMLHYLATGHECAPDFDLLFEKYLCGMTATDTTRRYTRLTGEMKTEADNMLASVIKHWSALKSSSVDALREGFLQRKGKVVSVEGSHRIVMEQSPLDILLTRIPWNISLIKLPWLQQLIHVEWSQ